jgi:predicted TIM-barrel fold metal-dependent hydrolase
LDIFLKEMDAAGIDRSVILPIDCSTAHGCKIVSNTAVADLCSTNPRLIGFASIDPKAKSAIKDLSIAIEDLGLQGLKLDPALQQFDMNSEEFAYPVYKKCADLKIPLIIHCGLNWAPPALTKHGYPLDLEPAILAHPDTNFVIAHLGWPWVNEASILAMKYPNVYLDTSVVYSGTPAECLDHVINKTIGKDLFERNLVNKVVYGSNYPRADMRRTVRGMQKIGFSDSLYDHLFWKNAQNLLHL